MIAALLGLVLFAAPHGRDATSVIRRVQTSYERVHTLKADFTQTYRSVRFDEKKSHGRVVIQKPGKMKWDYNEPKGRIFLADGKKITLYDPEEGQALVSTQPKGGALPVGLTFLWGAGKLNRTFKVERKETIVSAKDGEETTLRLVPKDPIPNVKEIFLTVRMKKPVRVVATRVVDLLGGEIEMRFENIRVNPPLAGKPFAYKLPPKTPVIPFGPGEIRF